MKQETTELLFALLGSATFETELGVEQKKLCTQENLRQIIKVAEFHDLAHLVILALIKNGILSDKSKLKNQMFKAVYRYERLNYDYVELLDALEKACIPFIPLKGAIIRKYYPEEWMRTSCDVDVLVKKEQLEQAISLLTNEHKYELKERGTHDILLVTPRGNNIELHFDLVEEGRANNAIKVLSKVWDSVILAEDSKYRYQMSDELFYFYHIAHMAKHFETGGCGIRPILDLYLLDNLKVANPEKRDELLRQGDLLKFAESVRKLSKIWFSNEELDQTSLRLQQFIISGGSFGTFDNRVSIGQTKQGGKKGYFLSRIFLPFDKLKRYYPVLEKHSWLAPFMQVRRWFRIFNPKIAQMAKQEISASKKLEKANANGVATLLHDIGLNEQEKQASILEQTNQTSKVLFALLSSAVSGNMLEEDIAKQCSKEQIEQLVELTKKHDIVHLLVLGLKQNGLLLESEKSLQLELYKAITRYEHINYEKNKLKQILEKSKIPFIFLKGAVLNKYYKEPWMRTSADIDVLTGKQNTNKIANKLVKQHGFKFIEKTSHDISFFTPSGCCVELHYSLIEDAVFKKSAELLSKVWERATINEGSQYSYSMSDEMFYFYHIVHMAKHFENGGCGIRPFIDLWILDNMQGVDLDKRNDLLEKGGLKKFAERCSALSKAWFNNQPMDSILQQMEYYILRGGVFGSQSNRIVLQQQKKGGRGKYLLSRIFLPYNQLKCEYPVLEKHKWLTPVMEVVRWFRFIFGGRTKNSMRELKYSKAISKEQAKKMQDFLVEIGL